MLLHQMIGGTKRGFDNVSQLHANSDLHIVEIKYYSIWHGGHGHAVRATPTHDDKEVVQPQLGLSALEADEMCCSA